MPIRPILASLVLCLLMAGQSAAWQVAITESTPCMNIFVDQDVENLLDGDPQTCWSECGAGAGEGEWVRFEFEGPVTLNHLGVANGCQTDGAFESYNRVKTLRVKYSNGASEPFTLADEPGVQYLPLTPMTITSLTIEIEEVYKAESLFDQGKTCLSDVEFVGKALYDEEAAGSDGAAVEPDRADGEGVQADQDAEAAPPDQDIGQDVDQDTDQDTDQDAGQVAAATDDSTPDQAAADQDTADQDAPAAIPGPTALEPEPAPLPPEPGELLTLPEGVVQARYSTTASSQLESQLGGMEFSAANLVDGSKRTAWVEGASGAGLGEWVEIDLPVAQPVSGLWIANGCQAGEHTFTANNRAKVLEVRLSAGEPSTIKLEDQPGMQFVDLGKATTDMVRLTLVDVYEGGDGQHTCLAEVRPALMAGEQAVSAMQEAPTGTPEEQALATVQAYFVKLFTLDDGYAQLFASDIRDGEELTYEVFREIQKQRGLYEVFRKALVDLETLEMGVDQVAENEMKVRVQGVYTVYVSSTYEHVEENSVFTLVLEDGRWRILDKQAL